MQEALITLFLWSISAPAAPPDAATMAKIKEWTRLEVEKQTAEFGAAAPGGGGVAAQLEKMSSRMDTFQNTVQFYLRLKNKKYETMMMGFEEEIAKACCPLTPVSVLKQSDWYRIGGKKRNLRREVLQPGQRPRPGAGTEIRDRKRSRRLQENGAQGN